MVYYKYLKMYYFDLFQVFQWDWAVFWPGTRKAKMLGLKTEKAISTKKKNNFIYCTLDYITCITVILN